MEVEEDDPFIDDVAVNDSSDLVAKMEVDAADAEDSALTADNNDHLPHSMQMQDSFLTADDNDPLPHSMQMQVNFHYNNSSNSHNDNISNITTAINTCLLLRNDQVSLL